MVRTSDARAPAETRSSGGFGRRLGWLVGIAALIAVVIIAMNVSEEHELALLVSRSQPQWILAALALQSCTYFALAQVWRMVAYAAHEPLARLPAARIALAKLFVDQTLPSLGISGGVLLASALARRGLTRPVVAASVIVDLAAYYFAYAFGLSVAIAITAATEHAGIIVIAPAIAFVVVAVALAIGAIVIPRTGKLSRLPGLRRAGSWLTEADRHLTDNRRLLLRATACELAIIALDSATLWTLLRAIGIHAPIAAVFASFMIASLARTLSIIPGGLGVFEGVAVLTLNQIGVPVAASLSAALLFRGLSYWLPMIPGFFASRGLRGAT